MSSFHVHYTLYSLLGGGGYNTSSAFSFLRSHHRRRLKQKPNVPQGTKPEVQGSWIICFQIYTCPVKRHFFYALVFPNTLPRRPLAPPQEWPRKSVIHRSYHNGVGNRCGFCFCHWGSVRSHAGRHSMQQETVTGGDNYQHVVIRLRGRFVRGRPEHDVVANTREVSRRFRVWVREYLPAYLYFIFLASVSFFPIFCCCYFSSFIFPYVSFCYFLILIFVSLKKKLFYICLLLILSMLLSTFFQNSSLSILFLLFCGRPLSASSSICCNL